MGSENQASENSALTLFGMSPEKGRWICVALGLAINVCMGSIYSWRVFRLPLQKLWSIHATASLLPFIFFLAFFALLMPFAGGPLDKYGPRRLTCLLYTSDAADDLLCVDLGGRRIIKKKKK